MGKLFGYLQLNLDSIYKTLFPDPAVFHPHLGAYLAVLLFIALGFAFAVGTLVVARMLHPRRRDAVKDEPYECGMVPIGDARRQHLVRYYVVAMLFVLFDVETVFLFPWAVVFDRIGLFGFVEMLLFIVVLLIGFVYAWKKEGLTWV